MITKHHLQYTLLSLIFLIALLSACTPAEDITPTDDQPPNTIGLFPTDTPIPTIVRTADIDDFVPPEISDPDIQAADNIDIPLIEGVFTQIGRGEMLAADLSPAGGYIAMQTAQGIYLYETKSQELLWFTLIDIVRLRSRPSGRYWVLFSPDGTMILVYTEDKLIVLDAFTGDKLPYTFTELPGGIDLTWSPDSTQIAVTGKAVTIWTLADGSSETIPLEIEIDDKFNFAIAAWSPDGKTLVAVDRKNLHIIKTARSKVTKVIDHSHYERNDIVFSPYGKFFAISDGDFDTDLINLPGVVSIWETKSGKRVRDLEGHKGEVHSLAWSSMLVSADQYGTVIVWDLKDGKPKYTLENLDPVGLLRWDGKEDETLILFGVDAELIYWQPNSNQVEHDTFTDHRPLSGGITWSYDGSEIVVAGLYGWINVYDESDFSPKYSTRILDVYYNLAIDARNTNLYTMVWSRNSPIPSTYLFDMRTGETEYIKSPRAYSPDGTQMIYPYPQWNTVGLFDVASGDLIRVIPAYGISSIYELLWSPDGKTILVSSYDRYLLYDLETKEETLLPETVPVGLVTWSPDGKFIAISGEETITLWDINSSKLIPLGGHEEIRRFKVAWSPDGMLLVTIATFPSQNSNLIIWNTHTGETSSLPFEHLGSPVAVAFSPDGKLLAVTTGDGIVVIFKTENLPH